MRYAFPCQRIYTPVYAVDKSHFALFSRLGLWITLWMVWMDMHFGTVFACVVYTSRDAGHYAAKTAHPQILFDAHRIRFEK